jgi:alkanesulfonate monooxygenase SsuD/methylene tetrahydromethanopterin reductase-like flavin-dependent oxidoreductase (luciferase family)
MQQRYGMTIPFDGAPLGAQRDRIVELADLGYTDVWSSEANGADAFTPLALTSVWAPSLRLGTAIVPAFTRGPACLAQSVGSLAQAAPGRVALGIGTSSDVIVEGWNGIPFE